MRHITYNLAEIIKLAEEAESEEFSAAVLKENWSSQLKNLLLINFNPDYQFLLPTGRPDFSYSNFHTGEETASPVSLTSEMRMMPYFMSFRGNPMQDITQIKREMMFAQILEVLSNDEADLLLRLKEKSIGSKSLNLKALSIIEPDVFNFPQESLIE